MRFRHLSTYHLIVASGLYLIIAAWIASAVACIWFGYTGFVKPHYIFLYFSAYFDKYEHARVPLILSGLSGFIPLLGLLFRSVNQEALHGDARWADHREIRKMGLFRAKGIILSQHENRLLRDDGVEHVLVVAPTRSGKGVGIVIPNLLSWPGSAVVLDIKFENYEITSQQRRGKLNNDIYLFAPGQSNSHRWNPLDLIDLHDPFFHGTIDMIAQTLCPDPQNEDPMWTSEGRNIFKGAIMALLAIGDKPSLCKVNSWIRQHTSQKKLDNFLNKIEADNYPLPSVGKDLLTAYKDMPDKQRGGVQSAITSRLSVFDDPVIDQVTSRSDFDLRDLRSKRMTVYLGANLQAITNLGPLFSLLFQLITIVLTRKLPDKKREPHKVLLLMDEFTSLGEMNIIKKGIAFYAGYHLRLVVIIQGRAQLESLYQQSGLSEFISNFKYQIIYAPNDPKEAKELSESLGTNTVKVYSKTIPSILGKSEQSRNQSLHSRALLLPDEILRLDRAKAIIRVEAQRPILASKVVYYNDPRFKNLFYNLYDKEATKHLKPREAPLLKLGTDTPAKSMTEQITEEMKQEELDTYRETFDEKDTDQLNELILAMNMDQEIKTSHKTRYKESESTLSDGIDNDMINAAMDPNLEYE